MDKETRQAVKDQTDEYPKEIVFRVKSHQAEMDLFELLYKHNVEYEEVLQERDTYDLDLSRWCD